MIFLVLAGCYHLCFHLILSFPLFHLYYQFISHSSLASSILFFPSCSDLLTRVSSNSASVSHVLRVYPMFCACIHLYHPCILPLHACHLSPCSNCKTPMLFLFPCSTCVPIFLIPMLSMYRHVLQGGSDKSGIFFFLL
jgi:hypothetical protein